ncbi:lamin tail domain-containing protein [Haloferula sp.]|uniref:lamin tail domain-containing protein n=1 Tax=Haloferula sp. TaxID=2497595 RepID=UPI003C73AD0D
MPFFTPRRHLARCLVSLTSVLALFPSDSDADLLWYSPMNANANAVVGSNGVPAGTPSAATDRDGNANAAVEFNGNNEYYDLGSFGTLSAGSLSTWVRSDNNADERGAFCAGASGGGSTVYFSFMNRRGEVRADLDDGDGRRSAEGGGTLAVGQWYHVATTWSAKGALRLFLDGVQVDTRGIGGGLDTYTMTNNGLIGAERTSERLWDGAIDDAGLWNEELSAREVAAIHGLGKFQGLDLNDPAIDTIVGFSTLGQTVTVNFVTWEYVSGLAGSTGATGGSIGDDDAFIVLDSGTGRGVQISSDSASPPSVDNNAATQVEASSATIGGSITDNGGEDPAITIYWGDNNGGTNPGSWDSALSLGVQSGSFSSNLTNLNPSTTYYFRSFSTNSGGSDWAPTTNSFITVALPNPPTVINSQAGNVGFTNAEIGGQVTDTGGEDPTVRIYWGDNDGGTNAGNWDQFNDLSTQSAAFVDSLANLADGVTYYFRCFAQNSGGSDWAPSSESFTTSAINLPTLTTSAATHVSGVSAQLNGEVTSTGGDSPVVTFVYGTSDGGAIAGNWDSSMTIGFQPGSLSSVINALNPGTSYFFRATASNAAGLVWSSPTRSFITPEVSELAINEFLASNDGGTLVPNQIPGTTDDWIEIHNRGSTTISLAGWHLTDDAGELDQWTFPPGTNITSGQFLVVFASGDNAPDANGNLHTNFKLGAGGEYVALVRPALTVASEFGPNGTDYPSQDADVSYGLHPSTLDSVYFQIPTPGAPNDVSGLALVEDTQFSHKRGFYTSAIDVAITTATPGATIRYTLDGSEPTEITNGSTYSSLIPISTTTVLRARAYKSGLQATDIDSQSYIFPNAVVTQTRPSGYPDSWGEEAVADYDVDTQISQSAQYGADFLEGLRDIPTLSVTGDQDDFFSESGIYSDTFNRNLEAAVSAEYFHPDPEVDGVNQEAGFQIDCGFKLQGGASRDPGRAIKHSLSLRFRDQYGAGKLNYPVFEGTDVTSFDSLHLRAMFNNSWVHGNGDQRARATMIRDQWARDTMIEMGNADGGQGHFAHLYINGIYWGVFNLHERLENDHFAAYNGYEDDEVFGRNPGSPTEEEEASYDVMIDVVTDPGSSWAQIEAVLDIDNYIDFVIVEYFGRNADLKSRGNWRAAGGGTANAPWRFYCWDTERIFEDESNTSAPDGSGELDGARIFDDLEKHREFRVRFADRAYKHLFNGGTLTNLENRARFEKYAAEIYTAIVCESARWGDDRSGGGFSDNYSRDENWTRAVYGTPGGLDTSPTNGVLGSWFPIGGSNRTSIMIPVWQSQPFTDSADTYLGTISPPVFMVNGGNQHGGEIPDGGNLSATASDGSIYYTTDGSDPRLQGGDIASGAILLSGDMSLPASGLVRMRARAGGGDSWSPLSEAVFYLERRALASDLRISEINYHAVGPDALEAQAGTNLAFPREFSGGDFEFLEICNVGGSAVNLDGVHFTAGLSFNFPLTTLAPGAYIVVVEDQDAFEVRYGTGLPVAGQFEGTLDNDGEQVAFATWDGSVAQDFTFSNAGSWPGRADGKGSSIEAVATDSDYGNSENWRSSSEYHGSPGTLGAGIDGRIVINEVSSHTDLPDQDSIELHNTTGATIPVANWYLSDSSSNFKKFRIPSGSITAGGYLHWNEDDFNLDQSLAINSWSGMAAAPPTTVTTSPHGLSTGDVITVSGYGGIGDYNGSFEVTVLDATTFTIPVTFLDNDGTKGTYTSGQPFAISAKGDDIWLLEGDANGKLLRFVDRVDFAAAFNSETLGRWPNGGGAGTLITMTANTLGSANSGPVIGPVLISEVMYHPSETIEDKLEYAEICNTGSVTENLANWQLRGGIDFDFSAVHELAPGEVLLVVGFDPLVEVDAASLFRTTYGIDATISLAGPWTDGPLRNDTGTVRLQRPDSPPSGEPTNFPQVTEDEVIYSNVAPWPEDADGNGESLNRAGLSLFGNFASSWNGVAPTPGGKLLDYDFYRDLTFGPGSPTGSGRLDDFDFDSVINLLEYAFGLDSLTPDVSLMPGLTVDGGDLVMTFTKNTLLSDLTYGVEMSADLLIWTPLADEFVSSTNYQETRKASVPMTSQCLFLRLVVTH